MFAAGSAVLVTIYFWWQNIKGVHESSGKALRIMQITTVMVVILLIWCPLTILLKDRWHALPPAPIASNLNFAPDAQGWFKGTFWMQIPMVAIIIAFGHSLLSMSGFETLAQVYREIAYPKLKNLQNHRQHRVLVRGDLHRRGDGVRGDDHSRRGPAEVLRQPDRRPGHEPQRALSAAAGIPYFRGRRWAG